MPNWKKIITSGSSGSLSNLVVDNHISASLFSGSFYGSGANLTGVQSDVTETATVTDTFSLTTSKQVTHGFNSKNVLVTVYNSSDQQIVPASVTTTDNNTVDITFDSSTSGRVVVAKGGHIVSGSQPVSEVATVTASFTSTSSIDINHNFNSKNILVSVYNSTDKQIIPSEITLTDSNNVNVALDTSTTGFVVVAKGGHIVQGTSTNADKLDSQEGTYYLDWNNFNNIPNGLVSGSTTSDFTQLSNNPFTSSAAITASKSIVPSVNDTYDLGSPSRQWRDLYLSSASLYIDGNQVLSSTADTLTVTTTTGQSIKLLETGADDIILQTDTGNIELKGTVEILTGKKIIDSAGTKVEFGDSLGITGSIDLSGTVDGVDVASFKSSFDTLESKSLISSSAQVDYDSLQNTPTGIFSGSFNNLSNNPLEVNGSSITSSGNFVPSINETYDLGSSTLRWRDLYLSGSTVFLGDTKISRTPTGDVEFRDRQSNNLRKIRVDELEIGSGASARKIKVDNGRIKFADTNDTDKTLDALGFQNVVTSSAQLSFNEISGKPDGLVSGSSQIVFNNISNIPSGLVSGSSQILEGSGVVSGSVATSFNELNNIPSGLVSGSSQILLGSGIISGSVASSFNELNNIPSGLVSGSSQVDYNSLQNLPTIPTNNNQLTNGAGFISSTVTGDFTVDTSTLYVDSTNNRVGIGTTSPSSKLDVNGTATVTSLVETSALRFKKNVKENIDGDIIDKLRPVSFDWKETKEKDYGFIAEEVNELDSTLTTENDDNELVGIKYTKLIPFLVKKVQDQQKEIDELKRIIKDGNS